MYLRGVAVFTLLQPLNFSKKRKAQLFEFESFAPKMVTIHRPRLKSVENVSNLDVLKVL